MKQNQKNIHHAFNILERVGYRYEHVQEIFESIPTAKHRSTKLLTMSKNSKVIEKLRTRVNEVEKMETDKDDQDLRLLDNRS